MTDLFLGVASMVVHDSVVGLPIETIAAHGINDAGIPWVQNAQGDYVSFTRDTFHTHRPKGTYSCGFYDFELHASCLMRQIRECGKDYTLGVWAANGTQDDETRAILMLSINVLDVDHEARDCHLFPIGLFRHTPVDFHRFAGAIRQTLLGE